MGRTSIVTHPDFKQAGSTDYQKPIGVALGNFSLMVYARKVNNWTWLLFFKDKGLLSHEIPWSDKMSDYG